MGARKSPVGVLSSARSTRNGPTKPDLLQSPSRFDIKFAVRIKIYATRILRGVGCKVSAWEQWGAARDACARCCAGRGRRGARVPGIYCLLRHLPRPLQGSAPTEGSLRQPREKEDRQS